MRVLIIDDDAVTARSLGRQMERLGHEPSLCSNAELALVSLAGHAYDVVLSDVVMPGLSGIELLQQMRAIGYRVPVILISGHSTMEMAVDAARAGATRLLAKPATTEDLRAALEEAAATIAMERETTP